VSNDEPEEHQQQVRTLASIPAPHAMKCYELRSNFEWIADDDAVQRVEAFLSQKVAALAGKKLLLGIDTEWGDSGQVPAVVQLAVGDQAWVIDTSTPTPATRSLFEWVFTTDAITPLGFSFAHDADRLGVLLAGDGTSTRAKIYPAHSLSLELFLLDRVVDLQLIAMRLLPNGGQMPGLKKVTERWLNQTLDKSEQCSNWDARPLSASQLKYAATDAAVLLDIAAVLPLDV